MDQKRGVSVWRLLFVTMLTFGNILMPLANSASAASLSLQQINDNYYSAIFLRDCYVQSGVATAKQILKTGAADASSVLAGTTGGMTPTGVFIGYYFTQVQDGIGQCNNASLIQKALKTLGYTDGTALLQALGYTEGTMRVATSNSACANCGVTYTDQPAYVLNGNPKVDEALNSKIGIQKNEAKYFAFYPMLTKYCGLTLNGTSGDAVTVKTVGADPQNPEKYIITSTPATFPVTTTNTGGYNISGGSSPSVTTHKKDSSLSKYTYNGLNTTCNDLLNIVNGYANALMAYNNTPGNTPYVTGEDMGQVGAASGEDSTQSCNIESIGWLVCPVVNFLANIADATKGYLNGFLNIEADKLFTAKSGEAAYDSWKNMLTIANILFVIAFLFIIFSQVTSVGISNYGIKKLLPKLVVVAVLVNVSFSVCTLAIDASNILGYNLSTTLGHAITKADVVRSPGSEGSWAGIAATVLIGGVAAYFMLASLIGLLVSIGIIGITIVTVLAIRQALIVLLVVISPIALAALLLPNTESLFKKWLGMFKGLLVLFPIVGLLYGAASMASTILGDVGASTKNMLMQMIASALPFLVLIAVYTLTKKALNIIDGLDGVANGILNKGSKANQAMLGGLRKRDQEVRQIAGGGLMRRFGKPFIRGQANREAHINAQKAELDQIKQGHLLNNPNAQGYAVRQQTAQKLATAAQTQAATNALTTMQNTTEGMAAIIAEEAAKKKQAIQQAEVETMLIKSGSIAQLESDSRDAQMTKNLAEQQRNVNYYSKLQNDAARQQSIGAASGRDQGAERVAATVNAQARKEFNDNVEMEKGTLTSTSAPDLKTIMADTSASMERRAAAVSMLAKGGTDKDIHEMLDTLSGMPDGGALQQQLAADLGQRKPAALGAGDVAALSRGNYSGSFDSKIETKLKAGKLSGESVSGIGADELDRFIDYATSADRSSFSADDHAAFKKLAADIKTFRTDPMNQSRQPADEITRRMDKLAGLL